MTPEECRNEIENRLNRQDRTQLERLQLEVYRWSKKNFPNNQPYHPLLGAVEEIGELCHAHLKYEQGIREGVNTVMELKRDAVADTIIYLLDYCARSGIVLSDALEETWQKVSQRDWTNHPETGE